MTKKALTLAAVFITTCACSALALRLLRRRKQVEKRNITEADFVEVMKIIARAIFTRLFEAAQVAQRAPARDTEHYASAIVSAVHMELERTQKVILLQLGLNASDLHEAQDRYYHKGNAELDMTVDCISDMFSRYSSHVFPVLPECVLESKQTANLSHDGILLVIRKALTSKTNELIKSNSYESASAVEEACILASGIPSGPHLYNEAAKRINDERTGNGFKLGLTQIVIECQNEVKSSLVD